MVYTTDAMEGIGAPDQYMYINKAWSTPPPPKKKNQNVFNKKKYCY